LGPSTGGEKASSCPDAELKRNKCLGYIKFLGILAVLIKIDDFKDSVPLFLRPGP
jgi:hypothetical protein